MDIRLQTPWFTTSLYLAPLHRTFHWYGWPGLAWWGKHSAWKHGFVVRLMWLGFVLRWGKIPYAARPEYSRMRTWQNLIEQANDGDYGVIGE